MFGGVQINGQDSLKNIYKRVGDLTIASPSTSSKILKTNYGNWEAMCLNSAGISMNTSLNVSGLTIINNATTCTSTLNVSGTTTLSNNVYINATTPNASSTLDVGGTSASTYYTFLNGLRLSGRDISIYHNVPNNDMAFHTNWSSTSGGNIGLYTRATARLSIDGGTGNIGMDIAPDASYKVKVGGGMM